MPRKKYTYKDPQRERSGIYLPDEATIRKAAEKIREGWKYLKRTPRRLALDDQAPVVLKEIRVADICTDDD